MKGVGTDIGTIHFVGIGGIGMSGIAEVMHNLGYTVQGSDIAEGASVERLRARGIDGVRRARAREPRRRGGGGDLDRGQARQSRSRRRARTAHAGGAPGGDARRADAPQATVAVAGTHGKTTTTSMVATLLDAGGLDPTVINGGIIESYGSNARLGDGEWMVVEADESDGSFLRLDGTMRSSPTSIPSTSTTTAAFDAVKEAFVEFVENVPFYGAAVLCIDHPEVQALIGRVRDRRVRHLRLRRGADWRAESIRSHEGGNLFDARACATARASRRTIGNIALPMPGRHNVQNALAAIAVAVEIGCSDETIRAGFARFGGVRRRFTRVGEVGGASVIDDYAHHPVEIRAVLAAAREAARGRVIAVVQPHRYTRLRDLMRRVPDRLQRRRHGLRRAGLSGRRAADRRHRLPRAGRRHERAGTVGERDRRGRRTRRAARGAGRAGRHVVCLGAGDITKWAAGLAASIAQRQQAASRAAVRERLMQSSASRTGAASMTAS